MYVKPKPGALVRDPETREPLPAEGAEVPENQYWMRRLADGDVVRAGRPTVAALPVPTDGEGL
ncbi:DUF2635 domain-containing protein [Azospirillum formosense]|uniref:DUF2635 domain-containing protein n=1 Tax=Azospirillum formosense TaxID=861533 RepID=A0ABX2KU95_9PROT|nr:DUF2635 domain-containing protein [Azospirillum formosense]MBY3755735.1 DUF2635 domain-containing protein [Azospirillum formosense]NUB18389.1 DUF2635 domain-containing protein [Azospirillum formosense]